MKNSLRAICAAVLVLVAQTAGAESVAFAQEPDTKASPAVPKPGGDGPKPLSFSDYDVLIQRNIFSHEQPRSRSDRHHRRREDENPENAEDFVGPPRPKDYAYPGPTKAEADIVLIGAVQRDGLGTATLEDRRAGKILLVKNGDKVASGTVGKITVDGLEYIVGDKPLQIPIGSNLEGGTSTAKPVENGATSSVSGGSGSTESSGGDMGSILEQMKRKRLKELGQ